MTMSESKAAEAKVSCIALGRCSFHPGRASHRQSLTKRFKTKNLLGIVDSNMTAAVRIEPRFQVGVLEKQWARVPSISTQLKSSTTCKHRTRPSQPADFKILQEQGRHNANDSKYHQSDIRQKQDCVPCIDLFHDRSYHCWPTAAMRDLKHGVQSLQEASIQALVVSAMCVLPVLAAGSCTDRFPLTKER